jgi:ATP-binding cassette subfamily A (ABC1) protein 3
MMGVCPQVNPIYPELTVEEHMNLYAVIKGMTNTAEIKSETEKILTNIDLYHKLKYPAGNLSGGQKRKLCVSLALIGDSKIILLDEPTSGMDTFARRHLWEMLKIYKKDKLIILTTHYMDEADFLGDRIAIMGEGRLITCGSSLFLKEKFGCGYDLTVVGKDQNVNFGDMKKVIREKVPNCKEVGLIGMELKYQLPVEDSVHFQELFTEFEERKDELGIQTFGVSLTTLEEVFLKVAQLGDHSVQEITNSKLGRGDSKRLTENVLDKELSELRVKGSVFWMHFWALINKRYIYFKKDTKSIVCEIILPSFIIILGSILTFLTYWNSSPIRPILPDFATPKYDFYSSFDSAASGWATAFAGVGTSELNVTRLTGCDAYSTATTYEDCLLKNTPITKDNANLFDFYGEKWDNSLFQYSYITFSNSTWPYAGFIANNLANTQILKSATGTSTASLKMTLFPMPLSHWQVMNDKTSDALTSCL